TSGLFGDSSRTVHRLRRRRSHWMPSQRRPGGRKRSAPSRRLRNVYWDDLRAALGRRPQGLAFDDDDSGVLGGSSDGASDASGSEAGHEPRVWVCGHCTKEHLLQMEEK
ncbi:unnamed protein product, partial [Ectocarpus sp. 13 AM-2016]